MQVIAAAKANLGLAKFPVMPALIKGMITTPLTFKLTAANIASDAALQTALQALLNNVSKDSRGYYWPLFKKVDNISTDTVYDTNVLGKIPVFDGIYNFKIYFYEGIVFHQNMFTHNGGNARVFFIDTNQVLWGCDDDAGNFQGFTIANLKTEKLNLNDGKQATYSVLDLSLANNLEWDRDGQAISGQAVNNLVRLSDLSVSQIGTTTATTMTVKVTTIDGVGLTGLVTADFSLVTSAGVVVTISGAAAVNGQPGQYTLTGTTFAATNVLTLKPVGTLSVLGYEFSGSVVIA